MLGKGIIFLEGNKCPEATVSVRTACSPQLLFLTKEEGPEPITNTSRACATTVSILLEPWSGPRAVEGALWPFIHISSSGPGSRQGQKEAAPSRSCPVLGTRCQGPCRSLPLSVSTRADNTARCAQGESGSRELGYKIWAFLGQSWV